VTSTAAPAGQTPAAVPAGVATPPTPATTPSSDRPEFIPEKFWDPEKKSARLEDLGKAYLTLETARGKGKQAWEDERLAKRPAAADAYVPTVDGYDPEFLKVHPLTPVIREIAYESGLDQEGFNGLAAKVVGALAAAAPQPEAELAKLGENATARVQAAENFVVSTFTDPAERDALALVATTAAGVKVIEKLQALASGRPIGEDVKPIPLTGAGRKTKEEVHAMMKDPRYFDPRKRDPAFVKEVEAWFESQSAS